MTALHLKSEESPKVPRADAGRKDSRTVNSSISNHLQVTSMPRVIYSAFAQKAQETLITPLPRGFCGEVLYCQEFGTVGICRTLKQRNLFAESYDWGEGIAGVRRITPSR
jgi:hypothetical protein